MSIRPVDVWMSVGDKDASLQVTDLIQRLLGHWIAISCEPLRLSGLWNGETVQRAQLSGADWEGIPLWEGEIETAGPLTSVQLLEPLFRQQLLATCDGSEISVRLGGALFHRPALPNGEPGWYGRAKLPGGEGAPGGLLDLVLISVEWSAIGHHVVVKFPLAGYPLTSVSPVLASGKPLGRAAYPEIVDDNRRRLFGWMAGLPDALGLPTQAVEWEINASASLFDDDIEALRGWEDWLRSGRGR